MHHIFRAQSTMHIEHCASDQTSLCLSRVRCGDLEKGGEFVLILTSHRTYSNYCQSSSYSYTCPLNVNPIFILNLDELCVEHHLIRCTQFLVHSLSLLDYQFSEVFLWQRQKSLTKQLKQPISMITTVSAWPLVSVTLNVLAEGDMASGPFPGSKWLLASRERRSVPDLYASATHKYLAWVNWVNKLRIECTYCIQIDTIS